MFCRNCGNRIEVDEISFCRFCGFKSVKVEGAFQCKGSYHSSIHTNGGAYVNGNVDAKNDFIGRDKICITILQSLDEIDAISPNERISLLLRYKEWVQNYPESTKLLLSLSLLNIDLKLYKEAETFLEKAHRIDPLSSRILYYRCIAGCYGKRPGALPIRQINHIEKYISAAISLNPNRSECLFLWAFIKEDFYESYELKVEPPNSEMLVKKAMDLKIRPKELRHLLRHVPVVEGFVVDAIRDALVVEGK